MKKEVSFGGMSMNENDQAFLVQNYLTKEKVDELKEIFIRKKENDGLPKDQILMTNSWNMFQDMGFLITDQKKFEIINKLNGKQIIDFKDVIKIYCQLIIDNSKDENKEQRSDILDAFSAVGGNQDGSGVVSGQKLLEALEEFGLTVDVPSLLESVNALNDELNFESFSKLIYDQDIEDERNSELKERVSLKE